MSKQLSIPFAMPLVQMSKGKCKNGKVCNKCGEYKSLRFFSKDSKTKDGLRSTCKECDKETQRKSRESIIYRPLDFKQCSMDGLIYPIDMFGLDKTKTDGHRSYCLYCMRRMARARLNKAKTKARLNAI